MTDANRIKALLSDRHAEDVFVPECHISYGSGDGYVDAWAMAKSWAHPLTTGYEIKVSRGDFISDNKWQRYVRYCNQFYFVCPWGLIKESEVPEGVGLLYVTSTGNRLHTKVKAPWREVDAETLGRVYKGILMSRAFIRWSKNVHPWNTPEAKRQHWEYFIAEKEEKRQYGWNLSKKIRALYEEKIEKVAEENRKLHHENESFSDVRALLEKIGVTPGLGAALAVKRKLTHENTESLIETLRTARDSITDAMHKLRS